MNVTDRQTTARETTNDRQMTDGHTTTYSVREREFTFAKNSSFFTVDILYEALSKM